MLFTLMAAAAASQALSLRPAANAGARSASFAKLSDLVKTGRVDSSLQEIAGVVNDILAQEGNATMFLTDDEQGILRFVIDEILQNMYGSMTEAQAHDQNDLELAIAAINACSQDWTHRIGEGDLYNMRGRAVGYQHDLNELQDDVDAKTHANNTAWDRLATHISLISTAPTCPALPDPRTMHSLDVYFLSSAYVTWYTAQSAAYWPLREAFREANRQLEVALAAYAVGLGVRDVAYCDWRREFEAGCAAYTECYHLARAHYENTVLPAVHEKMAGRIEIYKAGETIIHQIRFLLAEEAVQQTPEIDTSRYEMNDWPAIPPFTECDMSPLHDEMWVPTPECPDMCDETVNLGHLQDGYRGCQTHTQSGHLCKEWEPHWINDERWHGRGLGRHNYCRNPDHEPEGIWCYRVIGGWEYCNPIVPEKQLLNGCSRDSSTLSGWGNPRMESADQRAGEAICCDSAGQATRHVHDGSATFGATSHEICTTPNGNRLFEGDAPSYTFFEAKALCEGVGLSLCSTQEQLDSTCGTGCWLNTVLIWVE